MSRFIVERALNAAKHVLSQDLALDPLIAASATPANQATVPATRI
jgi:hypothetical protein